MKRPASLAILAYAWWGFVPLYWKWLQAFPAKELILYRVLLSTLFLLPLLLLGSGRASLAALLSHRRALLGLTASGLLIGFNWFLYVWAVNHGHVIESSLGYFINPLMNAALGTLVLKETLRPLQKGALGLAALGTLILAWSTGTFPWIALLLALSFALYGLVRKLLGVSTIPGTFLETVLLSAPAALGLLFLYGSGGGHGPSATGGEWLLLSLSGLITTIPLLAFAEAAKGLPLTTLGFFQFLSPSIQFLLGVFVFREPFGLHQWLSFALIWAGLALFLGELASRKPQRA